jgi:crossover junction endodeoxyribonuclease RuvC
MRILGIDPGLTHTGWGIIDADHGRLIYVAAGRISPPPSAPMADRLAAVFIELQKIITTHRPDTAAVEQTFVNANPASALKLGQARGVAMAAPAACGLTVGEYAANLIKKSIVGAGHADKTQIQMMIKVLLPAAGDLATDAADALAVAITHAHHTKTSAIIAAKKA